MKNKIIRQIGTFPLLREQYRKNFPTGIIVLKHGEHKGAGRGFGAIHILAEHTADLKRNGLSFDEDGVCRYIEMILQTGAGIYCEFDNLKGLQRPMIVRSRIGTVILERQKINGLTFYSVVTAFGGTKARGIKIGIMPK